MYTMKFVDRLFPDTYYYHKFPYIAAFSMGRSVRMMYLMFCLSFARESIPWPLCLARKKGKSMGGGGGIEQQKVKNPRLGEEEIIFPCNGVCCEEGMI